MNEYVLLFIGFLIGAVSGIAVISCSMSARMDDLRKARDHFSNRVNELTIKLNNAWKSWQLEYERASNIAKANEEIQAELYILEGCMETVLNFDRQKIEDGKEELNVRL